MFPKTSRGLALGLIGLWSTCLAGCRETGVQPCLDLLHAGRYEKAARRCAESYAASHDPRAGAAIIYAEYSLGHEGEVLAWTDRLAKADRVRAGVWSLAAAVHERRGEREAAAAAYRRDLELFRAAGDHQGMADSLLRLSRLAWRRSLYRDALVQAGYALQEASVAGDRGLQSASAGALYMALDSVGDFAGARRALEEAGRLEGGQDRTVQAYLLANRGNLLADEGHPALARRDLEQALELGAKIREAQFFRSIHVNLTKIHLDGGDLDRAAHHLDEAWKHAEPGAPPAVSLLYYRARLALARGRPAEAIATLETALRETPPLDWTWDLEALRGKAEEARGDLVAAEASYRRSTAVIEEMRRSLPFDELKSCLLDRNRQPFEALFRLQARAGRATEALATAERAEARTLLDAFLHTVSRAEEESPPALWTRTVSVRRVEALEALLPAMSQSPVASVQPIERVLQAFGDRHGLVFFEAGDALWLIAVAGGTPRLLPLAAPAAEIHRLGDRFIAHPDDAAAAERLAEILLPPGALPPPGRTLHIVVDGRLGDLPFAALRLPGRGGRYLVEDHAIVFLPSLNTLAALESHPAAWTAAPLALGDPRGDLPAARSEAMTVAALLQGGARTGPAATSKELHAAARARVLHLATHTGLGLGGPWLRLADGPLSATGIVTGHIGPRLAVLASCSSAARTGRQMWGSLGAAFLAAGSRSVLAALGSIEDAPARELVLDFYRAGGASDPAAALARAQRVAIGRGLSPNLWAPFVLYGSDRPPREAAQGERR